MTDVVLHHLVFLRNLAEGLPNGKETVAKIEAKTGGVVIEHILGALEVLLLCMLFLGIGDSYISNLVGFVYPSVATLLALESTNKNDDTEWLVYWVVFSTFCLLDPFVEYMIIYWIPYFYPLKSAFLLWMMLPQFKGANVIYKSLRKAALTGGDIKISKDDKETADAALSKVTSSASSSTTDDKNSKKSPKKDATSPMKKNTLQKTQSTPIGSGSGTIPVTDKSATTKTTTTTTDDSDKATGEDEKKK
jgi:receptor expression-enhancing protein 5/6